MLMAVAPVSVFVWTARRSRDEPETESPKSRKVTETSVMSQPSNWSGLTKARETDRLSCAGWTKATTIDSERVMRSCFTMCDCNSQKRRDGSEL